MSPAGLPVRIGLASVSASVDFPSLVRVAAALSLQVNRDVVPIWGTPASVIALENAERIDPGIWPVFIADAIDGGGGGFHQTEHNQPMAMVLAGDTWSLAASHETIEMLVDPSGNRLVAAQAVAVVDNEVQDTGGKFEYLVEVCDPSEDASCAYLIDGVLVSDFCTPNYYDPAGAGGARYSFSGRLTRPRQVLPNGYLSWFNPATGRLQQVRHFGAPTIVDLGPARMVGGALADASQAGGQSAGRQSLRSFIDSQTRAPQNLARLRADTPMVQKREQRRAFLASAAPLRASLFAAAAHAVAARAGVDAKQQEDAMAVDPKPVLAANLTKFARPGVLSVRPGLRLQPDGAAARVIVATVLPDQVAALAAALPGQLDGVPVDVRPASVLQVMRSQHPAAYLAMADARHELRQPDFADEVFFDGAGNTTPPPAPLAAFEQARARKPQIDYTPAPGVTLDAVTGPVSLILHASPDAGWEQLSAFLAGVQQELVVGMYDFTSAHILAAVEAALAGKKLTLTLDHPAPNPSRDQTDEETVTDLQGKLGAGLRSAWALTNSDRLAPAWIYPNAYHIKVAVREDDVFWLSSGNWNNSNQPEIDLTDPAAAKQVAAKSDRDWHVIATSPALAAVFRAFLLHDNDVASRAERSANAEGIAAVAGAAQMAVPDAALAMARAPRTFFPPKTITGTIPIQPLLTPDNYKQFVGPLIASTTQKFYMQTQYIHPSGRPGDEDHDALIAAVRALVDAGRDVRLITSEFQTDAWVEKLTAAGIPPAVLRRQNKVHNKGIVVDGSVVMVSSQNWSADGTLRNRDAGLVIHDAEAAAYFEQIFLHDWDNLASPVATA